MPRTLPTENLTTQIKQETERKPKSKSETVQLLPTGVALLDLSLSDSIEGGFAGGTVVNLIGDSHSGKTLLGLTILAEIASRPDFNHYHLIHDDAEEANNFDIGYLFGKALAKRIQPPAFNPDKTPRNSETVEEFQAFINQAIEMSCPCVYLLDSLDALTTIEETIRAKEQSDAILNGKEQKGTYAMEKAKKLSAMFRTLASKLARTGSLLIVISQTRDNIDPMSFAKKTRAGGKALDFYCTHIIWLAAAGAIKKKETHTIGGNVKAKISKNKLTGKPKILEFRVFYDYGIDSIGAAIDWMVRERFWSKKGNTIQPGGNLEDTVKPGIRETVIRRIEDQGLEPDLQEELARCWEELEESLRLRRKPKYT